MDDCTHETVVMEQQHGKQDWLCIVCSASFLPAGMVDSAIDLAGEILWSFHEKALAAGQTGLPEAADPGAGVLAEEAEHTHQYDGNMQCVIDGCSHSPFLGASDG